MIVLIVAMLEAAAFRAPAQSCSPVHIPLPDGDLRNQAVPVGQSIQFCEGILYGTGPFTYQWLLNGIPISGATNQCYMVTNAQFTDAGFYQAQVFNACGSDITGTNWPGYSGQLTVGYLPTLAAPIGDQNVAVGQTAYFSVSVNGTPPFSYFWYSYNSAEFSVPTSNSNSWTIPSITEQCAGPVFVQVGNSFGTNTFSANLAVSVSPVITTEPVSKIVLVGSNVMFTVAGSGTSYGNLNYEWQFYGTNLPGATSSTLVVTNVQVQNAGSYDAVATNPAGSTNSAPAQLDVRYAFLYANGQFLAGTNYSFSSSVVLSLTNAFPNGSTFYTLDGSSPTFASSHYSSAFNLTQSAIVRTLTYSADFSQSGETAPVNLRIGIPYTLATATPGGGTIALNPTGGSYMNGSVVQVTAIPLSGWTFLGWQGDGAGTNNPTSIVMSRNKAVQAIFGTTLSTTVAGNGSVSVAPNVPLLPFGSVACLTAIPQTGSYFGVWGNAASGSVNPLYFTISNPTPTVSSLFAVLGSNQVALSVVPQGAGEVITNPRSNSYALGDSLTVTAAPGPGQTFLGWSGDASGSQNPLSVTMDQSKTIIGSFTQRPSLSVRSGLDGLNESGFRFTLFGVIGGRSQIEATTDLLHWQPLSTITNLLGTTEVTDSAGTNLPSRSYRVDVLP